MNFLTILALLLVAAPKASAFASMQYVRAENETNNHRVGCDFETITVLLTNADVAASYNSEAVEGFAPKAFDRQAGVVQLSDPNDNSTKLGDYSFLITFLDNAFGCLSVGAYTFVNGSQITFTASCSGLPFFSITGGQGDYSGAAGYVEFRIPTADGTGNLHKIHVCRGGACCERASEDGRRRSRRLQGWQGQAY